MEARPYEPEQDDPVHQLVALGLVLQEQVNCRYADDRAKLQEAVQIAGELTQHAPHLRQPVRISGRRFYRLPYDFHIEPPDHDAPAKAAFTYQVETTLADDSETGIGHGFVVKEVPVAGSDVLGKRMVICHAVNTDTSRFVDKDGAIHEIYHMSYYPIESSELSLEDDDHTVALRTLRAVHESAYDELEAGQRDGHDLATAVAGVRTFLAEQSFTAQTEDEQRTVVRYLNDTMPLERPTIFGADYALDASDGQVLSFNDPLMYGLIRRFVLTAEYELYQAGTEMKHRMIGKGVGLRTDLYKHNQVIGLVIPLNQDVRFRELGTPAA